LFTKVCDRLSTAVEEPLSDLKSIVDST